MIQNSKKTPALVLSITGVNETTKKYAGVILDIFKTEFDHLFDQLGLEDWETANDIIKESLSTKNMDNSLQKIQVLVEERSKRYYASKNSSNFLNFACFLMRMLHLSEFEPDYFCVQALEQFQGAFTIRFFGEFSKVGNRFEVSEEGRKEVLKYVSEELRKFLEEKVLENERLCQSQEEFLAELLASVQKSEGVTKIEAQIAGLSLAEDDDKMNIEFDLDVTKVQEEKHQRQSNCS